ncbi:MAG: hypothetical protein A3J65_03050 [Candidatus Buchananbacteria bacterium RIFCSPHIGHO2_02_FULL_45_11b]|uniref:Uncharacterized protein n=1 Tax=Candidatus Buchananbacteria bacterium RIFCSPHIGHO2_02_FULL_45_11b TaxID=1797541 RepID=A0A1G1YFJ6_9BACT|nr:MAG: hypothetical protein A3J65_03050 [Candidatus Buchananbacteria bacterium RIFCSPHIGHO2_02_FULL_45_11b]
MVLGEVFSGRWGAAGRSKSLEADMGAGPGFGLKRPRFLWSKDCGSFFRASVKEISFCSSGLTSLASFNSAFPPPP